MKSIAFLDLDGTITRKDTLLEFIKFSKGNYAFYRGMLIHFPYLLAYKLAIISNQAAKEKILSFFFSGIELTRFNELCTQFSTQQLPHLIRPKALNEILKLKSNGFDVVIVSASPENWIEPWTNSLGIKLIASKLETRNGKLTGKINGKNCHGQEKVRRIRELYNLSEFREIIAYGDSKGDKPMMQLASTSFFRPFHKAGKSKDNNSWQS